MAETLVSRLADYVATHPNYESWTKREAVEAAVDVILGDIGAAQEVLESWGVPWDLYASQSTAARNGSRTSQPDGVDPR